MDHGQIKLQDLVDEKDSSSVLDEITHILKLVSEDIKIHRFKKIYIDVIRLFEGRYPGYLASNTKYHDLEHTSAVTLAVSRLIHGAYMNGWKADPNNIMAALAAALFHDVGLIQTSDDAKGTGAKYTIGHEKRSISFLKKYFVENRFSSKVVDTASTCIRCTILDLPTKNINFKSDETKTLGYMVGSADILAQMADRHYLEKLFLLFQEFEEGGVPGLGSEMDLLKQTEEFYHKVAKKRLRTDLGGVSKYMRDHFKYRWDVDKDLYHESISKNIQDIASLFKK